ncbi:MAG: hypothetical protein D6776_00420 [Planctomycetota bacterium]|nr:MAG: hypothetical protein D6776_00420 [Planctomycetota bacterium]
MTPGARWRIGATLVGWTVREALQRPLLIVALFAMALFTVALPSLLAFEFGQAQRMARELGYANLRLTALFVAILLGPATVGRDREEGMLLTLLVRPLGPAAWLLGRFLGGCLIMALVLLVLSATMALALEGAAGPAGPVLRLAAMATVLLAVAVGLASALPPALAAIGTVAVFGLGHVHGYVRAVLASAGPSAAGAFAAVVPDLEAIGLPLWSSHAPVGLAQAFGRAALAAAGYLAIAVAIAQLRETPATGDRA